MIDQIDSELLVLTFDEDIPLVSPMSRVEEQEREEELDKLARDIYLCGMLAWGPSPASEGLRYFRMKCGHWREDPEAPHCPRCLDERTRMFRERGELCRDFLRENLGILRMGEKEFKKLARKFRRQGIEYWRIPVEGEEVIVLFDATLHPSLSHPLL